MLPFWEKPFWEKPFRGNPEGVSFGSGRSVGILLEQSCLLSKMRKKSLLQLNSFGVAG